MKMQFLALLLASVLSGCVSGPSRQFSFENVGRLRVGMTEQEVLAVMPEPSSKQQFENGVETWSWHYNPNFLKTHYARIVIERGRVKEVPGTYTSHVSGEEWRQFREGKEVGKREEWVGANPSASEGLQAQVLSGAISPDTGSNRLAEERRARTRAAYLANPDRTLPPEVRRGLEEGLPALGMTQGELLMTKGLPTTQRRTVNKQGVTEQWVYGEAPHATYYYFLDGELESWEY